MSVNKKLYGTLAALVFYGLSASFAHAIPIVGTTSGVFNNPIGPSGMIVTGVGTSSFAWGNGALFSSPPSSLDFSGTAFNTNTETTFDIGDVTYFNGTIADGTQANSVDLDLSVNFTTPSGINQLFSYLLTLINTTNTGDQNASADIVQFPTTLPTSTFTTGGIAYTVGLEVGTVSGGGFSSQTTFSVFEGQSARAKLRGIVTAQGVPQQVPEPATLSLLGAGLLGFGLMRRRKRAA